jgi:hypothetical protein
VDGEKINIPVRINFNEPNERAEKQLTVRQKDILNCIYTRHHNGYVREKRLKNVSGDSDKWKIPYLIQLLGEYIYEILPVIDKSINENTLVFYTEFINENPKYWQQTESRMISYWNEYYRHRFPDLKKYLGYKIINRIKKAQSPVTISDINLY